MYTVPIALGMLFKTTLLTEREIKELLPKPIVSEGVYKWYKSDVHMAMYHYSKVLVS